LNSINGFIRNVKQTYATFSKQVLTSSKNGHHISFPGLINIKLRLTKI